MSGQDVNVNLKTTSDTKGVEDVQDELKKLDKVAGEAEKKSKDLRKVSDQLKESNKQLSKELSKEADRLRDVSKAARETQGVYRNYGKTAGDAVAQNKQLAKSGRNTGLAFLEVSRAAEDAQYGINGVLNNLPNIITLFGGPAGLAAAVSLVAVGFVTLIPLLKESNDLVKIAGDNAERAAKKKREAFELEKKLQKESKAEVAAFKKTVNAENGAINDNIEKINDLAQARAREFAVRQAVADAKLSTAITEVENSGLSELEKVAEIQELVAERQAQRDKDDLKVAQDKIDKQKGFLKQEEAKLELLKKQMVEHTKLTQEIEGQEDALNRAQSEIEVYNVKLKAIADKLDKELNKTFALRGDFFFPDLNDDKFGDDLSAYLAGAEQRIRKSLSDKGGSAVGTEGDLVADFNDGQRAALRGELLAKISAVRAQVANLESQRKSEEELKSKLSTNEKKKTVLEKNIGDDGDETVKDLKKSISKLSLEINSLGKELGGKKTIQSEKRKQVEVKNNAKLTEANTKDLQAKVQKLADAANNEAQAQAFEAIGKAIEAALVKKDGEKKGGIDDAELSRIKTAIIAAVQDGGTSADLNAILEPFKAGLQTANTQYEEANGLVTAAVVDGSQKVATSIKDLGSKLVAKDAAIISTVTKLGTGIERVTKDYRTLEQRLNQPLNRGK